MICIPDSEFEILKNNSNNILKGEYRQGCLHLFFNSKVLSLNWKKSKTISFQAPFYKKHNLNKTISTALVYRNMLSAVKIPTSSAVLFGFEGGNNYLRSEIEDNYPEIVKALISGNASLFLKHCRNIAGLGHGSSPNGDDLIHGALIAFHSFISNKSFINSITSPFEDITKQTNYMGQHVLFNGLYGFTSEHLLLLTRSIVKGFISHSLLERIQKTGSGSGFDQVIAMLYFILTNVVLQEA